MVDNLDFTHHYNTFLPPNKETEFQGWAKGQSSATGRDVTKDLYDYDLRGWHQANPGQGLGDGHLTDQFKKPNHPTFSDQSQYDGADGHAGGKWTTKEDGSYSFTPGNTNYYSKQELGDYFNKVEPGNELKLPDNF